MDTAGSLAISARCARTTRALRGVADDPPDVDPRAADLLDGDRARGRLEAMELLARAGQLGAVLGERVGRRGVGDGAATGASVRVIGSGVRSVAGAVVAMCFFSFFAVGCSVIAAVVVIRPTLSATWPGRSLAGTFGRPPRAEVLLAGTFGRPREQMDCSRRPSAVQSTSTNDTGSFVNPSARSVAEVANPTARLRRQRPASDLHWPVLRRASLAGFG